MAENKKAIISYSDIIGKDDTFKDILANIEKLKKELKDLARQTAKKVEVVNPNDTKQVDELTKKVAQYEKQLKELREI